MNEQQLINYDRIAQAIDYIKANFKEQPNLDKVAEMVHLSPFHFQRLFSEWAGTTPKKFLQFTTIQYAKDILKQKGTSLFDATYATGLSSTGRLHDLFIKIEGMTPADYKNGGKSLAINFSFAQSPFGRVIVASTEKGICHMAFVENEATAFTSLKELFPHAIFRQCLDATQEHALHVFNYGWEQGLGWSDLRKIKLHLKGSAFQLKVWQALLQVPFGQLTTYGQIAQAIQNPNASRAVGTAIGSNPVAFLIPCHRVIQSSGVFGGYMWGETRKTAIIGWEATKVECITDK